MSLEVFVGGGGISDASAMLSPTVSVILIPKPSKRSKTPPVEDNGFWAGNVFGGGGSTVVFEFNTWGTVA